MNERAQPSPQAQASDPRASAWVSANAGSGKTTVLVRRVIRLLLDGVPPGRILCLTYTKAAAAHMANKVLERLSASIQDQMLNTDRPIGLLWKEERLETFREIVRQGVETCTEIAHYFDVPASAPFVSRTYLIHHGGRPMGMITERWPLSSFREPMPRLIA